MAYKFKVGPALVSGSLVRDAGDVTVRTHAGAEAVKLTTAGAVSGSGNITMNGAITMAGSITAGSSFIIGSADLNEADMEKLDGITDGTVAANKAVVVDSDKDASGFRHISGSGYIQMTSITASYGLLNGPLQMDGANDFALDVANDSFYFRDASDGLMKRDSMADYATAIAGDGLAASSGVLAVGVDDSTIELDSDALRLKDNGVTLAKMAGITRGSIIIGDSSGDPSLLAKGTAAQFLQSDGTDPSYVSISGDATVAAGGALTIANDAVESGMLNDNVISGQTELAADGLAAADEMMISDGGTLKKIGVDNLFMDGPGLLGEEAVAVANDYIMFLDGGATGDAKKESIADLVSAMAGAGLAASSGQLSVQGNSVSGLVDGTALSEGYNFATGSAGGTCQLPASPSVGDVVTVKSGDLASTKSIVVTTGGSHAIDGLDSIAIESAYGAVTVVYVDTNDWRIV